jgi:hypothetical protein
MDFDDFLNLLDRVRRSGSGYSARCPAHEDRNNSLSINEGEDGRILVHCHAGCTFADIVAALELEPKDLFADGDEGDTQPARGSATPQPHAGCTLEDYTAAKELSPEFLSLLGLSTINYCGAPAVRIPYVDEAGNELGIRFRISLTGDDRFRWKKGSKPHLYGLNLLKKARELGYVILVEGESDVHTLWSYGYPAVGLPGAALWNEDRDAARFDGLDRIYVVIEPDRGGQAVLEWLTHSSINDRARLVRLDDANDISELHLQARERTGDLIEAALQTAQPWSQHAHFAREIENKTALEACSTLTTEPDILSRLVADLEATGLVGEQRTAKLIYLALVSRLLDTPVSVAIKGPSAAGKSHTLARILELFPDDAYYELTAMSERALVYSTEPLSHRVLVVYEAAGLEGDFASYLIRSLLSEGKLRYETVEKTGNGLQPRIVERAGPTGLIVTTTQIALHPENETRLLSLPVTDTPEQTRLVLLALAEETPPIDVERWQALQTWLATGPTHVSVPFAKPLAELIPPVAIRLRRDFRLLLSLIRTHALLHRASRHTDKDGNIIATLSDYKEVRELAYDLIAEGIDAGVPATTHETVEAVAALTSTAVEGVSITQLAERLKLDKGPVSRRVRAALKTGYLRNVEDRKGRPAKIILGDPLPADIEVLPTAETLDAHINRDRCTVADSPTGDTASPTAQPGTERAPGPRDVPPLDSTDADEEIERLRRKFPDLFDNEGA